MNRQDFRSDFVGIDPVALLRTLGLVEDGDIQSKVLALHKEPHAIGNVNCRL